jgi:hypothetical protein
MPDLRKICPTRLIADSPTKQDAFGHSKVAEAIAHLVKTEDGAKCIGLTGSWGSGKSSVVEILCHQLAVVDHENSSGFVFDAWAHQGDPLRRSFLEQLIDSLLTKKWLGDPAYWMEKKQELARRIQVTTTTSQPQLTTRGGIFAITLLLLPLGYELFVKYFSEDCPQNYLGRVGLVLILLPFIVVVSAWLAWRPSGRFWEGSFWKTHRKPHHEKSLLALFLNKSFERVESNTIRTPDPTSVEFQQIFGELIQDALKPPGRRLLIIIDNLDRVDVKDALAIWATLKTFFDFDARADSSLLKRLWLLLPFDETAIRKLWANGTNQGVDFSGEPDNGAELAQSFVDKTFQITFRVAPPVLSDWQEFLKRQLREAFPNHNDDDFHKVYRIYDLRAVVASKPPTPRDIKLFVNRIGAIHRLWEDSISLAVQALYVVLSKSGNNLAQDLALTEDVDILGNVPVDMVGADWRESLAAVHFNVPKDRALQVVIGGQLRDCLSSGKVEIFTKLASIPGFTVVLEKQMEGNSHNWARGETNNLAIAASMLAKVPEAEDSSWTRTWDLLCIGAESVTAWSQFDNRVADGIIQILKRSPKTGLPKTVIEAVSNSFPKDQPPTFAHIEVWLDGVFTLLHGLKTEQQAIAGTTLAVDAPPETYIKLMTLASTKDETGELLAYLKPAVGRMAILQEVNKVVSEGKFDDPHRRAVTAMRRVPGQWLWDTFTEAICTRLKTTASLPALEVGALLSTLISMPEASARLKELTRSGYVPLHLQFSVADANTTALCVIPMLEYMPAGDLQAAPHPNSRSGVSTFNQILADQREEIVAPFTDFIGEYKKFDLLYDAPAQFIQSANFCKTVLKKLASTERVLECIPPERIIASHEYVKTALGDDAFKKLVAESTEKAALAGSLISDGFNLSHLELYRLVLDNNRPDTKYEQFLIEGMRSLDKSAWLSELTSEGSLLDLLVDVRDAGHTTELGIAFEDALVDHAQQLIVGSTKVERLQSQWNAIFEGLKKDLQSAALGRMLELLFSSAQPTDALLQLYGDRLSATSLLSGQQDRVVLIVFSRCIDRLRLAELQWCCLVLEANPNLLTEVSPSTKHDLEARIAGAAQQHTVGEEVKNSVLKLAKLADVNVSKPSSQPEEGSGSPELDGK